MNEQDNPGAAGDAYGAAQDDLIRELYRQAERPVDTLEFCHELDERVGSAHRRAGRRQLVRRASLAVACLALAAGLGVGIWQGVQHLPAPHEVLVIGESETPVSAGGETTTTTLGVASSGGGLAAFASQPTFELSEPSSVTQLRLTEVWAKAATTMGFNPNSARLENLQVTWGGDGLLAQFDVRAATPDSRHIEVSASPPLGEVTTDGPGPGPAETITFTGSIQPTVNSGYTGMLWSGEPDSLFVPVARVLAGLDDAGLMEIGTQSGLEVVGDPAELWKNSPLGSLDSSAPTDAFGAKGVPDRVRWQIHTGFGPSSLLAPGDLGIYLKQTPQPAILWVSQGRVARLQGPELDHSHFPAVSLVLDREWSATWESGGGGATSGGGEAYILLGPWDTEPAASVESHPVDSQLDGLAFATPQTGTVCLIRNGQTSTIWKPSTTYISAWGSYGVAYSLHKTELLCGAAVTTVALEGSDSSFEAYGGIAQSGSSQFNGGDGNGTDGASWKATTKGDAVVFELSPTETAQPIELLRTFALPLLNRLDYDETGDRLWIAKSAGGYTTLQTAQPHTAQPARVLEDIGGDFAVSPDGSTIIYLGPSQTPATVMLRTPAGEKKLALDLASAYTPVYSPDGSKVCLVGSRDANGETALWSLDAGGGNCTEIAATRGLTPTYPVFSPDGRRIAFRNWKLGDIWTVDIQSGELTRYALQTADAPFAW